MTELPLGLKTALESGESVLFVGAGIGEHLRDAAGEPAPDGPTLARDLAQHFSIESEGDTDLATIAQVVELRKGRTELETFLQKRLADLKPDDVMQWLFSLRWKAIYTTNYDDGIERAYSLIATPTQRPITVTLTPEIVPFDPRLEVPIYHLHGFLFGASRCRIVVTEDDYAKFRDCREMLYNLLKVDFATSTILYIGYSNRDPNWKVVQSEMAQEFSLSRMPKSYRIAPETSSVQDEILRNRGIETVPMSCRDFQQAASQVLAESRVDIDQLRKMRSNLPTDFGESFDKNPVAVRRLLSSWTYVNQAPFGENPNVRAFLHGDRANWALVACGEHFERDIEEEMYDDILDYATTAVRKPRVDIILGPAGYGVTTLMMSLAAKLVKDEAGTVFMLKAGHSVLEGDVEYASSVFPDLPVFFFVNNAADHSGALYTVIHRLRESGNPAMFILGERTNEWREGHGRLSGKEFLLESLSDPEIERLLDCLQKHGELGAMENLTREMQRTVVREKHGKELLVAMREATEGRSFDAILEDEYRGISDSLARRSYLTVCSFHQHGAYVRDNLLAQLLDTSLPELYSRTGNATEGVVIYDCVDEARGAYAARARHRTIAAVVWERCGQPAECEQLLQSALSALNLNYRIDRDAFDCFIRSDRVIDSIRSLEGQTHFFETACRKDPENPYVRQHYSRMLSRADRPELALQQVDEALRMNRNIRVLHHTKGVVLMQLALSIESVELARRRLAQSEESFRQCLRMYARDEYAYQGLAQLYLAWAKRAPSPEEAAEYVSKSETTITEGLRTVRVREGLWIQSSNVQKFLGDEPSRVEALERALEANPTSVISRYLLGRAYRKAGRPDKTIDILDAVIKNHPDEFRAFVEYALALVRFGRPYAEAIAVLKVSTLYGLSDPRFIGTLGGMLFMNGSFSEAQEVFGHSSRHDFTAWELHAIQFRPRDPRNPEKRLRIHGKVKAVRAGFAIIESPGYPTFFCPGSKFGGLLMERGVGVWFEAAFSAKGAVADQLRCLENPA